MIKKKLRLDKELLTNGQDSMLDGGAPTWSCQCTLEFCTFFCGTMATNCGGTCECDSGHVSCESV
jgi:hypothetical protein